MTIYTIKKILSWLKNYWYIPIILVVGVLLFFVGRTDFLKKILKISRESNEKQQEAIKKAEEEEKKRKVEAKKAYDKAISVLEKKYKEEQKEIDKKTKNKIKKLVKKHEGDPGGMAKEFADEFGLVLVEFRNE